MAEFEKLALMVSDSAKAQEVAQEHLEKLSQLQIYFSQKQLKVLAIIKFLRFTILLEQLLILVDILLNTHVMEQVGACMILTLNILSLHISFQEH